MEGLGSHANTPMLLFILALHHTSHILQTGSITPSYSTRDSVLSSLFLKLQRDSRNYDTSGAPF